MMSKEFLKKLGILGISFGLIASPLAFGDFEEEEETTDPVQEQFSDDYTGSGVDIEYENEEEEWEEEEEEEWDEEEENEEEEWEEEGDDDGF
ncbi:hypothetical protein [Billgrantia endophytica]|uniref:hypothetical protein n=1 Tax=Billgrantia endophytica TaxID=2033802 RepID=UPI00197AF7CB|nr:hypothetical protein [Halomonas endophytica]